MNNILPRNNTPSSNPAVTSTRATSLPLVTPVEEDDEVNHDDCEINECFECYERWIDRAELWADLAREEGR